MSYIGNSPISQAFVTDQFSGTGSQTAFTMSVAPANTASCIVAVSGVLQDPSTYSVSGTTLTFSVAPPTGTGNISVRYLGIPATGVTTTAYRTVTEFTATASQTTFTPPSYTVGFLNVYRNGVLLGSADYTATNGTTVVLATGCIVGDLVTTESFLVSSVLNAIPNTTGSISSSNLPAGLTITSPTIATSASLPANTTLNSLNITPYTMKNRIINGDMRIWQRGTSVAVTGIGYWADRFATNYQPYTASRSTDAPAGFQYSADINPGATVNYTTTMQRIESLNCADLVGQTVTISCYAKSITGASAGLTIQFDYANAVDNFSGYTNIGTTAIATTLSSSWTRYSATFTNLPSSAANGLQVIFYTNNTVAANYRITGIQLEVGSYATPFEWRPYGMELSLCQRYLPCYRSSGSTGNDFFASGQAASATVLLVPITFPVTTRVRPTGIAVNDATKFVYLTASGVPGSTSAIAYNSATTTGGLINATVSSLTAGNSSCFGFSSSSTTSDYILFTGCEL